MFMYIACWYFVLSFLLFCVILFVHLSQFWTEVPVSTRCSCKWLLLMLLSCNTHTRVCCIDSLSPTWLSLSSTFDASEVHTGARPISSMLKQAIGRHGVFWSGYTHLSAKFSSAWEQSSRWQQDHYVYIGACWQQGDSSSSNHDHGNMCSNRTAARPALQSIRSAEAQTAATAVASASNSTAASACRCDGAHHFQHDGPIFQHELLGKSHALLHS